MTRDEFFNREIIDLRFDNSHSIIAPNIKKDKYNQINPQVGKFGLFGDSPNFNTYYPDMDMSEIIPEESDFIYPIFRLLSEVIVVKYGVPIDFTQGILKASLSKLSGITVFPDHDFGSIANSLGVVLTPYWQESYIANGIKVPAGINGVLKLDAKSNPRIARLISMDPPAIHSSSVTVQFKKEKSHPEMSNEEFWEKAGSFDEKGNLIRFIVNDIVLYMELSLVSRGADPFAQKINKDGEIVNPSYAGDAYKFNYDSSQYSYTDYRYIANDFTWVNFDKTESGHIPIPDNTIYTFNLENNKFMEFSEILEFLGLDSETYPDVESLVNALKPKEEDNTLQSLMAVYPDLSPETLQNLIDNQMPEGAELVTEDMIETLNNIESLGGIDKIRELLGFAETYISRIRLSATSAYKLVSKDNPDPNILKLIEESDPETVRSLETQYQSQLEERIPLVCQDCGSDNVSRQSHKKDSQQFLDDSTLERELAKSKRRKPSSLHVNPK